MSFNKFLSVLLSSVIVSGALAFYSPCCSDSIPAVDAAEITVSNGSCGDRITYSLDDNGTLSIRGMGSMTNYKYGGSPFCFNPDIKKIVISDGVRNIGDGAFLGCTGVSSISFPDSVESFGESAFAGCTSLPAVKLPDSLLSIGKGAFASCLALNEFTAPLSVRSIGADAFINCPKLAHITILNPDCDIDYIVMPGEFNGDICGYANSSAQKFAVNYWIPFVTLVDGSSADDQLRILADSSVTLVNGDQYRLPVSPDGLMFKSNNTNVAVVSKSGIITAVGIGEAKISIIDDQFNVVQLRLVVQDVSAAATTTATPATTKAATTTAMPATTKAVTTTAKPATTKAATTTAMPATTKAATTTAMPATTKAATTTAKPVGPVSFGDPNGDKKIDANDATLILVNYSLLSTGGKSELSPAQFTAADVNSDGMVDASDATVILQYYSYLSTGGSLDLKSFIDQK